MSIPRLSRNFRDLALDSLYRLAKSFPSQFTAEHANLLQALTPGDPAKCIAIIAIYCQHLPEIESPVDVTALLSSRSFLRRDSALDYVKLTYYLLSEFEEFRTTHLSEYTSYLLNALGSRDPKAIAASCRALSYYSERPLILDDTAIGRHFFNRETASSIIELLLTTECVVGAAVVKGLCGHLDSRNASFALLKIGGSSSARALVQAPLWLSSSLPATVKVKLLICLILHQKLRRPTAQLRETINFLCQLAALRKPAVARILWALIRRLVTSEETLAGFRRAGFLSTYFGSVMDLNDSSALESALLVLDTFVDIGYLEDYAAVIPELRAIVKRGDKIAAFALDVVVKLARFPEARPALEETKFPRYFEKIAKVGFEEQAAAFRDNWKTGGRR
jgi:hypothetical protein